ncbi:SpaA isopeptide-forming pilin-related protein [Bacillus glycinifermentans]|uniref:SpaA isopeptide-forming pilin-related protein n=1 Tax=Bacillus glycinifermentans TaxID=1664069 RepID=UPI002DBA017A|nr:SpaA isopeptide-forming pilin-related protein [Bacillus glycinifermentans]MEC0494517.1 SpaA isopeptide-forming pilin-related protein [Bacillus glycinifermentans]MEC0542893.1 SpaA isopeptide-forming pilin-related protein [Bacillus glycinifermentans]
MRSRKFPFGLNSRRCKPFLITGLMLFFVFSQLFVFPAEKIVAAGESTSSGQLFDSVTVKNGSGQTVDGSKGDEPALTPGDEVKLTYDWSLKNEMGTDFTIEIPQDFTVEKDAGGDVTSADQQVIGTYQMKANDNTLKVTLNSSAVDSADAKGTIALSAKFAPDAKDTKTADVLFDLGAGKTQRVMIPVKTNETSGSGSDTAKNDSSQSEDRQADGDESTSSNGQDRKEDGALKPSNGQDQKEDGESKPSSSQDQKAEAKSSAGSAKKALFSSKAVVSGGKQITQNILTGVELTDENGAPYDQANRASTNSPAKISITWAIPDDLGKTINAGDRYEFDLPKEFIVHNDITNQPLSAGDTDFGTFSIDTSGHVVMTFNDQVKVDSNVEGTLFVNTQFNQQKITGATTQKIKFPVHSDTPEVTVYFKPNVSKTIDKSGTLDKGINPGSVTWTVDANKKLDRVTNAKLSENFPAGLNFSSVKVYQLDVNIDGSVSQGSEVTSGYSVDANGNVTFSGTIDSAYRLVYETVIDNGAKPSEGGNVTLTNKASFSGDNLDASSAEATVTAKYGKMLEKSSTGYNGDSQTFSWAILYNYGEKQVDQSKAIITDTFGSDDLHLVSDSLKVVPITFSQGGGEQAGTPLQEGVDYTLTDNGSSFNIHFNKAVSGAYKITYQTQVNSGVVIDQSTKYTNSAVTGTGESREASGTATQQNIVKGYSNVDYGKKTVDWSITINKNNYTMNNWTLNDQFDSGGLALVDGSINIQDTTKNVTLQEGKDYTLTIKPGHEGFALAFIGDYAETNSRFKISYTTKFNVDFSNKNILNSAGSTWTDHDGKERTNKVSSGFKPNNQTFDNGFKNGSYNAVTKKITWKIGINYNGESSKNPYIQDAIADNQQFDQGSLVVKSYTINKNGSITEGDALDPSKYEVEEPSADNDNTLTVHLKTDDSIAYLIEFTTSLKGQVISQNQYTNKAAYHNNGHPDRTLTGSVSVANGGNLISKGGKQNGSYVDWNINVNSSQSTLDDVKITDTPDENQILDEDSFKVYQAKYNENGAIKDSSGNLVADENVQLEKGKDYTLNITTDNATGAQSFVLNFTGGYKQIDRAYVVQYRSLINITGTSGQVSNKVSISGTNVQEQSQENGNSVFVVLSSGGGSGSGEKGSLTILKTGKDGKPLTGADFQLWTKDNKQLLRSGTTDADGKMTFGNIRYGTYVLKETKAPDGYTISDAYTNGVSVAIDGKSSSAGALYQVINEQNKVTLIKRDEQKNPLTGAVFKLEKKFGDGTFTEIRTQITSDENGKVEIIGLPVGDYRLVETKAPAGFILNTEAMDFSVTKNDKNQVPDIDLGTLINYKGSAELTKEDAEGRKLEGAVFKIVDENGNTVRDDLTSNQDGKVTAEDLAPGRYAFVETKAPEGYVLNSEKKQFTISESAKGKPKARDAGTAVNYKGSVQLTKEDAEGHKLEGAVFKIVDEEGNTVRDELTSDQDGIVAAEGLAPGRYAFVETKAPEGYVLNSEKKEFTVSGSAEGKPKARDAGTAVNYKGSVQVTKVDAEGHKLEGAVFKIVDEEGNTVRDELTSDQDGKVAAEGLAPGRYAFVETKALEGYVLNSEKKEFTVSGSAEGKPKARDAGTAVNYKGSVHLTKKDEDGNGLADAVFKIVDNNGKTVRDDLVSGKDGSITADGLAPGSYQFVEKQAPDGYLVSTGSVPFTIGAEHEGQPEQAELTAVNTKNSVVLTKVDQSDKDTVLPGTTFNLTDSDGKVLIADLTTDEKGQITVRGLEPGEYRFVETKAPENYKLDQTPIPFTISNTDSKPVEITEENILTPGDATLTKADRNDHNIVLKGAEFKLVDSSGHPVKTDSYGKKLPAVWTTDQNGQFTVKGLAPGEYQLIETKAPAGYKLDETPVQFVIEKGQTKAVELLALNSKIKTKANGKVTPGGNVKKDGPHNQNGNKNGHLKEAGSHNQNGDNDRLKEDKALPKTGDTDVIIPMIAGVLLLLAGGTLALVSRKRRRKA